MEEPKQIKLPKLYIDRDYKFQFRIKEGLTYKDLSGYTFTCKIKAEAEITLDYVYDTVGSYVVFTKSSLATVNYIEGTYEFVIYFTDNTGFKAPPMFVGTVEIKEIL